MALIDALNAASHPSTSPGASSDIANGYTKYLCADTSFINAANFEQLFGVGAQPEDEMVIALPDAITPVLDGFNRFDFSDISAITNVIIALFRPSTGEWTSADLSEAPPADTTAPVITINGYASGDTLPPITVGDTNWAPPTATATDETDGDLPVTIDVTGVDINTAGNYAVGYSATDAAGNESTAFLTQPVQAAPPVDTVGPVITINGGYVDGDTLPSIDEGDLINLPSATAYDNEEAQAVSVSIDSASIDVNSEGDYPVQYAASDSSNNTTTVTLIQPVRAIVQPPVDPEPPVQTSIVSGGICRFKQRGNVWYKVRD